ncbi:MAG: exodeoxyribonuclease VII large subunit [Paracoccaceae bacterium]
MKLIDEKDNKRNIPEYNVSDISGSIKKLVENEFGRVRIKGELGRVFAARSGHLYYDIKDEKSVLAAVTFKGQVANLSIAPEEGIEVVATGKITTFGSQSKYQLLVDDLKVSGVGALMAMLEKRKDLLSKEGLFDIEKKKKLPYLPSLIGVITSPQGAVLSDILHRLRDRFPRNVIVWPVTVQGEFCADQVSKALRGFNALSRDEIHLRPEVIIVARGGGSIEDLWAFNEESVVREVALSEIPIISAIGHETDTTLIDYAADIRAPTPTAAAELVVPVRKDLIKELKRLDLQLSNVVTNLNEHRNQHLLALSRILYGFNNLLDISLERLKYASGRLPQALGSVIQQKKINSENILSGFRPNLLQNIIKLAYGDWKIKAQSFFNVFKNYGTIKQNNFSTVKAQLNISRLSEKNRNAEIRLDKADKTLTNNISMNLKLKLNNLENQKKMLRTLSYKKTLERGYSVIRSKDKVISSISNLDEECDLIVEFKDGKYILRK